MKYLLFSIFALAAMSCTTQKRCAKKFPCPEPSRDSIRIETIKEVSIPIPGDSIYIDVPIDCPDQDVVTAETKRLKQTIRILNGKLQSITNIPSDTIFVPVKEVETVVKEVTVPKPVKYVPKFWKITGWSGIGFFILLIGYIAMKFRKK